MSWLFRPRDVGSDVPRARPQPPPPHGSSGDDSPAALLEGLARVVGVINRNAGRLPAAAVVNARGLTDTLREIVSTSDTSPLDIHTVISVHGMIDDYLPTTLSAYLAVEPELLDVPRASGHTPTESLLAQLAALQSSASSTLAAARSHDADALITQGAFLRTKFSRSDLDL